jgi:uncharacterized protein (TIGR02391 family)
MNLQTRLPTALWESIRSNYEQRNFTASILDAFYFLSELLRNKSGTEGDGATLIGQALGGAAPKVKLNRLQTESEQNVQRGMEQMLRGLYQSIRNPRSHDKYADSEEEAQSIISFIGYIVRQLDQAKAQFSRADFVNRVLDPDFVPKNRYAELLVAEVPMRARLDAFLGLYREIEHWKPENMRIFLKVFMAAMTDDEVSQACQFVTQDLETSETEDSMRFVIGSFPEELWPRIGEAARLRVENKLIRSVREGRYDAKNSRCRAGGFGTWSSRIFENLTLKDEMIATIGSKIRSQSAEEREYVFKYLFNSISKLSHSVPERIATALTIRLKAGDIQVHNEMEFIPPWEEDEWPMALKEAFTAFQEADLSTNEMDDDIPF